MGDLAGSQTRQESLHLGNNWQGEGLVLIAWLGTMNPELCSFI